MARKRSLQPTFQGKQLHKLEDKLTAQRHLQRSKIRAMNKHHLGNNCHSSGVDTNEIEVISDEELPSEDQHEDGELSEIRLGYKILTIGL